MIRKFIIPMMTGLMLLFSACSSESSDSSAAASSSSSSGGTAYSIGGSISGHSGDVVLQNNSADDLTVASGSSSFTFGTKLASGAAYSVTVKTAPSGQSCSVSNNSGSVANANITDIAVTCETVYTIGGSVSGNTGSFTVKNTINGETLNVGSSDTSYTMANKLKNGTSYNLTIETPPSGQACSIANATGTMGTANVSNINITCEISKQITGTISNATSGNEVIVWLYNSNTEVINKLQEKKVTADGTGNASYSFDVANGTYYIRAFEDVTDDDLPDIASEKQTQVTSGIAVSGSDSTGNNVALGDASSQKLHTNFEVWANHETAEASKPGDNNDGTGLCRGFHIRAQIEATGSTSALKLLLPTGVSVEPKDDGGCSNGVKDNSSKSYDDSSGDDKYQYGVNSPATGTSSEYAGDYKMFYLTTNYIHISKDTISDVKKLPMPVLSSSPFSSSTTPTITWSSVTGASKYAMNINDNGGPGGSSYSGLYKADLGDTQTYTIAAGEALAEDRAHGITVFAMDSTSDVDARSQTPYNSLIVDTNGDNTATVSGTITNSSSATGNILVEVSEQTNNSRVWVSGSSSPFSYSVKLFKSNQTRVTAFVDVAGTYDQNSTANDGYRKNKSSIDTTSSDSSGNDLTIRDPVVTTAPAKGATGTGDTPTFSWQAYSSLPSTACYVLYAQQASSSSMPEILWALETTTTSYDMSNPPANKTDVTNIATGGGSSNPTDLSAETGWKYGVVIVECAYDDSTCLGTAVSTQNFYSESPEKNFTTN